MDKASYAGLMASDAIINDNFDEFYQQTHPIEQ